MRTTLFFLPFELGPLPVFGWGWVAIAILICWAILLGYRFFQKQSQQDLFSDTFSWLLVLGIVVFFAPNMETRFPLTTGATPLSTPGFVPATETSPAMRIVGLPVRGYGIFLMAGVVAGVLLIAKRGETIGIQFDQMLSLAIWSVIGGMMGARIFFVIQKWSEMKGESIWEKLFEAFKFTEGGLVVYGGLFGGLSVAMLWCFVKKIPMLRVADLATPAFLIGLAFGRIGCLMNGCCFGGVCQSGLPAVTFPMASPPYIDQLILGKLIGVEWNSESTPGSNSGRKGVRIEKVAPQSWADANHLKPGDIIDAPADFAINPPATNSDPAGPSEVHLYWSLNGMPWYPEVPLPDRSLLTHPSQIYASINAALLCGFLFWIWPNTRRSGTVLGLGLVGYGISRILEEFIRVDESGQFGTNLSISQWVSLAGILLGIFILAIPRKIELEKYSPSVAVPMQ